MKCVQHVATATLLAVVVTRPALGQPSTSDDEITRLRATIVAQQQEIEAQGRLLEELRALVLQQGRILESLAAAQPPAAAAPTAALTVPECAAVPSAPATASGTLPPTATAPGQAEPAHDAQGEPEDEQHRVNPTQEIAKEGPPATAMEIGPVGLRVGGYLGLTGIFRSTNAGGGPATPFGTIPYDDTVRGNVSETRLSAQSTRLSLRVDAPFPPDSTRFAKLAGYFEMDFSGQVPGTVTVTSTSVGFRLRHAFGEVGYHGNVQLAVGQAFSLMTPVKDQLSVWPSAFDLSQAVDTNYIAGLVWARSPQVRVTWRPSAHVNWAVSVENPEQQVGKDVVRFPACCTADLDAQYNTGGDELRVPNLMPDLLTRLAFNVGPAFHADLGGVFRVFRHTLAPYDRDYSHAGGGVSLNVAVRPAPRTRLLLQNAYGSGMGRYVGGLVPDIVVRADGSVTPVRSYAWVGGAEWMVTASATLAGYYSGVYAFQSVALDADGSYIGFGYPGAPDTNNRRIREASGLFAWQIVRSDRGSVQWNLQASWVGRSAWWPQSAASADAFLFLTQLRYNLP